MIRSLQNTACKMTTIKPWWHYWLLAVSGWALHLFVSYSFVEWYCQYPSILAPGTANLLLLLLTVICFSMALWAASGALRTLKKPAAPEAGNAKRAMFLSRGGFLLGAFLSVTILVQGWPALVIPLCSGISE